VSGQHAILRWAPSERAWSVLDVGSLNGTRLNGRALASGGRRRGRVALLGSDDILCLGTQSALRVVVLPPDLGGGDGGRAGGAAAAGGAATTTTTTTTAAAAAADADAASAHLADAPAPPLRALRALPTLEAHHSGSLGGAGGGAAAGADAVSAAAQPCTPTATAGAADPALGWEAAAVSRLGLDHARRGGGCEDVTAMWAPGGTGVAVLAGAAVTAGGVPSPAAGPRTPGVAAPAPATARAPAPLPAGSALLAVFDGHGGGRAASDAASALPGALGARLESGRLAEAAAGAAAGGGGAGSSSSSSDPSSAPPKPPPLSAAWASAFAAVDAVVAPDEGTTATAVLTWTDAATGGLAVQAANVGDSAAILVVRAPGAAAGGSMLDALAAAAAASSSFPPPTPASPAGTRRSSEGEGEGEGGSSGAAGAGAGADAGADARLGYVVLPLTADHRLTSAAERARLAAEGVLLGGGGTRLYGLNLSRCLGDASLKAGEGWGLSGSPSVSAVHAVGPGECALVLAASDGVWDALSARRAAAVAVAAAAAAPDGQRAAAAAAAVVALAVRRHARDDVTCAVAVLRPGPHPQAACGGGCGVESEGGGGGGGGGGDGGSSPPATPRAAAAAR